jgi:hypothetical protein
MNRVREAIRLERYLNPAQAGNLAPNVPLVEADRDSKRNNATKGITASVLDRNQSVKRFPYNCRLKQKKPPHKPHAKFHFDCD